MDTTPHPADTDLPNRFRRQLAAFLDEKITHLAAVDGTFADAAATLSEFVLGGGKRIRPTFAWWGWRAAGGSPEGTLTDQVRQAISSLELIQASALVHDDLMDSSDLRRGKPTVHVEFTELHRAKGWLGDSERFGAASAILLGDLAWMWAEDMFFTAGLPPEVLARGMVHWQAMRSEMLTGQYLDIYTQVKGDESEAAAMRISELKTAAYTVREPLLLGAALAGASPEIAGVLHRFGADIGIAFQLRDDILGVFGDPEVTGKPAGDDLREGKRTLLVALGLRAADDTQAAVLRGALGNDALTDAEVQRVRELFTELGTVAEVERRISTLTDGALAMLDEAPLEPVAAVALRDLAIAATSRSH
ncbi:polyprenyl synthetase family protein [Pseudonocardiaceae bacterium YIM PH 21723]|nr:polyprenyl synthetase family protein [Pseudonocardiaceae bacterium YIM PH 21723]